MAFSTHCRDQLLTTCTKSAGDIGASMPSRLDSSGVTPAAVSVVYFYEPFQDGAQGRRVHRLVQEMMTTQVQHAQMIGRGVGADNESRNWTL